MLGLQDLFLLILDYSFKHRLKLGIGRLLAILIHFDQNLNLMISLLYFPGSLLDFLLIQVIVVILDLKSFSFANIQNLILIQKIVLFQQLHWPVRNDWLRCHRFEEPVLGLDLFGLLFEVG